MLYHVYRAAEMDRAWSHGVLMPRWAESFYTGYGAPLFHYYASLTYYVTSVFTRLFALDTVNSLRLLIALCMLGSGAGMYAFARAYSGTAGGIIAALCYVYSPYILFTEPYSRGAYPELLAFALFPTLMWSHSRLIRRSTVVAFALAVMLEAALIITHNLMALVMTGLLVAWLIWSLLTNLLVHHQSDEGRLVHIRPHLLALLAVALGVGLTAYFWLPVVSEGSAVKLANLTGLAELNYRNFFVPVLHLLEPNPRVDAGALNSLEHRLNLGVPQWTLALTGAVGIIIPRILSFVSHRSSANRQPPTANRLSLITHHSLLITSLFFLLASLALIALILSASAPIWQVVAPLAFLQFPWRLLGPAVFYLAFLAGMNALWLQGVRFGNWLSAGIVVFIIALAAPTLYITEWKHETVDTSVAAYHDAELLGLQRATTFSDEYLPATVVVEPGATPRLLDDYADGYPVNKAHLEVLPPDVTVEVLDHGPQHDEWRVQTPAPFTMEVLTYYFPGWTAEIDGQPTPVAPSDPHGLITFTVPEGDHTVRLYLGRTPARDMGNAIMLISVVAIGVTVTYLRARAGAHTGAPLQSTTQHSALSTQHFLLAFAITLFFLLAYMREGGAWVNSPPGEAVLAQHPVMFNLGDQIQLIGYDVSGTVFHPGDRLELVVYWYARERPAYGYNSFAHVWSGGIPAAQADKLNPAGLPTKTWTPDGHIRDEYIIMLPDTIASGEYQLLVGLWTCEGVAEGEACGSGRLPVTDTNGNAVGDSVPLGTIVVR